MKPLKSLCLMSVIVFYNLKYNLSCQSTNYNYNGLFQLLLAQYQSSKKIWWTHFDLSGDADITSLYCRLTWLGVVRMDVIWLQQYHAHNMVTTIPWTYPGSMVTTIPWRYVIRLQQYIPCTQFGYNTMHVL